MSSGIGASIHSLMDMSGRSVVVIGGAGHIGTAASAVLTELGAEVVIADLPDSAGTAVATGLTDSSGRSTTFIPVDITSAASVTEFGAALRSKVERLSCVVVASGVLGGAALPDWDVAFESQSIESFGHALSVNVEGPFRAIQELYPLLKRSGHGSVVLFGSIYGSVGPDMRLYDGTAMGNPAGYAASKGGVAQLARWLATVLAPDIRVNTISPGGVARHQSPSFVERYESRTPLGRMATEDDLKGAVAYLSTDMSAYVTGQNLVVDGGFTSW
jgi:NAD(P)-dependent dehydrogenase (short-subunit alcohol dehydrogenase family)